MYASFCTCMSQNLKIKHLHAKKKIKLYIVTMRLARAQENAITESQCICYNAQCKI